jgi:hypothetical protein
MASLKQKTRTPKEKPNRIGPLLNEVTPALPEPPRVSEQRPDQGSRIALAAWLIVFLFLCGLVLWDLITAVLFR